MTPQQGADPKKGQLATRTPSRYKTATVDWAHIKNGEDAYVEVSQATVLRDALYLYYLALWSELPAEIREDIEPEYMADQIETVPGDFIARVSTVDVTETVEVGA